MATDDLLVTVAPSPLELEQLAPTFELAADVDAISATYTHVLLCKVRAGTRSSVEACAYLSERRFSVLEAEIHLWETYSLAYGAMPSRLGEYEQVLGELSEPMPSGEAS